MRLIGILAQISIPINEEHTPVTQRLLQDCIDDAATIPPNLLEEDLKRELGDDTEF